MRMKFVSKLMALIVINTLVFGVSCRNEENIRPNDDKGKVSVEPLTDQKIIAEIQAMASGRPNATGRTEVASPVTLPPGYNYSNMTSVTISGTSWTTYVAYSNTVNYVDDKEMVAIYYQGGVYKNYVLGKWQSIDHPRGKRYYHKLKVPENFCGSKPFNNSITLIPAQTQSTVSHLKVYPPSVCGQAVVNCVDEVYTGQGWLSLGVSLLTMVQPEMMVVIGGCMIGCAMYGPTSMIVPC
jgi:hypothetical protein